jgi:hypothetical protein
VTFGGGALRPAGRASEGPLFLARSQSILLVGCLLAFAGPAVAQEAGTDESANARIHLGPVGLSPRIALTNVGVDTNVLNQANNPQRDFTATFVPGVDSWLPVGRALVSGKTSAEVLYFRRSAGQRAANFSQTGRIDLFLVHLTPHAEGGYITTSQRPNAEIDVRVRQTSKTVGFGSEVRVGANVTLDLAAARRRLDFANEQFLGVSLAQVLNRRTDAANVSLRVALTPLTTFVVKSGVERDRFEFSPDRDTHSVSVVPGFEFKPSAIISGSAFVGYKRFHPVSGALPDFRGAVAAVNISYVLRDMTRVTGMVDRGIEYSFEPTDPYYVETGGTLSVTQMLFGNWDAVARAGRQRLDYRGFTTAGAPPSGTVRRDRTFLYGAGIGYRLQVDARVGFDVTYSRRVSPVESRGYKGFQFGGSLTYGF